MSNAWVAEGDLVPPPKYIEARRQQYATSARKREEAAMVRGEAHGALSERARDILSMADKVHAARAERAAERKGREVSRRAKEAAAAAKMADRAEREARREATRLAASSRFKAKMDGLRLRAAEKESRTANRNHSSGEPLVGASGGHLVSAAAPASSPEAGEAEKEEAAADLMWSYFMRPASDDVDTDKEDGEEVGEDANQDEGTLQQQGAGAAPEVKVYLALALDSRMPASRATAVLTASRADYDVGSRVYLALTGAAAASLVHSSSGMGKLTEDGFGDNEPEAAERGPWLPMRAEAGVTATAAIALVSTAADITDTPTSPGDDAVATDTVSEAELRQLFLDIAADLALPRPKLSTPPTPPGPPHGPSDPTFNADVGDRQTSIGSGLATRVRAAPDQGQAHYREEGDQKNANTRIVDMNLEYVKKNVNCCCCRCPGIEQPDS